MVTATVFVARPGGPVSAGELLVLTARNVRAALGDVDNRCYPSFSDRDGRLFSIWWPAPNAVRSVD